MGEQDTIRSESDPEALRLFSKHLLADLRALERMHREGLIESGRTRIGAEQEVFLVGPEWRPAAVNEAVLERLDDPHFTTELGRFNIEFNLDPLLLDGPCLSLMEEQINELLRQLREAARQSGTEVVLTGILPTLDKSDLGLDSMTPSPRYFALNEAMNRLRGRQYDLRLKGRDEIMIQHDNVMLEACNTAFQVHFQVAPEDFARRYNVAQLVAAPVLACATNSPLLFGRQLWSETRIALFQQSIDTRTASHLRHMRPRVSFGGQWVRESALEIFQEDVARFRSLLCSRVDEHPLEVLDRGGIPELAALRLHNSTVYRWNRPCYGISEGRPHLRIENRVLPSGPTPRDEMANAAFWFGLMKGVDQEYGDVTRVMEFEVARENFVAAARLGLGAQLTWTNRERVPAAELIRGELLPLARHGLEGLNLDAADADLYLGVLEDRVRSRQTGSQWLIDSLDGMKDAGTRDERLVALTAATVSRQQTGKPGHTWAPARLREAGDWRKHYLRVEQLMTTDLFTLHEDELVDLAAYVMNWKHIRHIPVEDTEHRLVGLVTHRSLLRLVAASLERVDQPALPVGEIMQRQVVTARPQTSSREALDLMRRHKISCLPVVEEDNRLVGIVTERDFMGIAGQLLDKFLNGESP